MKFVIAQAVRNQKIRPHLPTILREKIPEERVITRTYRADAGGERGITEAIFSGLSIQVALNRGESVLAERISELHIEDLLDGAAHFDRVRAFDRGVELEFALRNVALGTLRIARLRQVDVILAGREIYVVVAGTASRAAGILEPGVGLRRMMSVRMPNSTSIHRSS